MNVLDLFSGLGGWSSPFREAGHPTFTIELSRAFPANAHIDAGNVSGVLAVLPWRPDIILASPPCTSFTTMTMGRNWTHDGQPRTPTAVEGRRLVLATIRIIAALRPAFWIIENPRARLRTLDLLEGFERRTVTYCQLGEDRMKPTDLWGVFPPSLSLPPVCRNGSPCHIAAPRGSRTGTQGGVDSARAALIPRRLAELVRDAAERDLKCA